jgi:hypothetical protein
MGSGLPSPVTRTFVLPAAQRAAPAFAGAALRM